MINLLRLKFGRAPGQPPEPIEVGPVTVFVGPNNSGKSRVLSELDNYVRSGQKNPNALILDDVTFKGLGAAELAKAIQPITLKARPTEGVQPDHLLVGTRGNRQQVSQSALNAFLLDPNAHIASFCQIFLTHLTLMLDGRSRIDLVNQQAAGDLQEPPHSSLQVLFRDDAKRKEVRRIIYDAFGVHFVIDPTQLGQLRVRMSDQPPASEIEERGLHDAAVQFHSKAKSINETSDGVKAFTGIVTELVAGDPKVLLIDEPEAFLHPSLTTKLGIEVSRAALNSDKRVFVSTHSAQFVMGCIHSGAAVNIVRLTYRGSVATARLLPSAEILKLMRNPLLRSTGVLSGLFYEFVVVTESDADRAFYQEVNERLLRFKPEWAIPNCLFINAQNKQTVSTIIQPLRRLGIPAVGLVDIDVLKDGGTVWTKLLESAYVPAMQHQPLAALRASVRQAMDATGKNMKLEGGIAVLAGAEWQAATNLLDQLAEYGVFVVRGGELEAWLKGLGATGHGPSWLIGILEMFGEDPESAGYLKPSDGDVWQFLFGIKQWLVNSERKGVPA